MAYRINLSIYHISISIYLFMLRVLFFHKWPSLLGTFVNKKLNLVGVCKNYPEHKVEICVCVHKDLLNDISSLVLGYTRFKPIWRRKAHKFLCIYISLAFPQISDSPTHRNDVFLFVHLNLEIKSTQSICDYQTNEKYNCKKIISHSIK